MRRVQSLIVAVSAVCSLSALAQAKPEKPTMAAPPTTAAPSMAAGPTQHVVVAPTDLKWGDAPPSLPKGAKAAVVSGDPKAEGPFTLRLKLPANYKIGPHWHPAHEHITVMSGTFSIGMGEKFDPAAVKDVKAGGFVMMPPKHAHFVNVKTETEIQLHGWGPWAITYFNPSDDPRQQAGKGGAGDVK